MFGHCWKRTEVGGLLLNALLYHVLMFNMYSNVSLDTRKRFLYTLSPKLLSPSVHHDLFCTLLLVLSFLSFTTPISSSISSSFILLFLCHISSISSIFSSRFFYIFLKSFENHWSYFIFKTTLIILKLNRDTPSLYRVFLCLFSFTHFWRKQIVSRIYT